MKGLRSLSVLGLVVTSVAAWAGCGSSSANAPGDEQDVTSGGTCKVFFVKENRFLTAGELSKLNDPVAKKVLQGGKTCPTSLNEISAKLAITDAKNCGQGSGGGGFDAGAFDGGDVDLDGGGFDFDDAITPPGFDSGPGNSSGTSGPPGASTSSPVGGSPTPKNPGVNTRIVSDRSQVLDKADSYRAVITRQCDGRTDHELFMSVFGIGTPDRPLPQNVEMIGEDTTKGVFDFYAREDGQWKFFGSSLDLIGDGYDCDAKTGACEPKAAAKTRCASCHVGGGLIMKEIHSPWVNWDLGNTPGLEEMFAKHGDILGERGSGIDMETTVTTANSTDWVPKRVEFLKTKGVAEVLRPLFCTLDMNLQSGETSANQGFFLDQTWNVFDSVDLDPALYAATLIANKQVISNAFGKGGIPLQNKSGTVTDTFFAFTYPERGNIDLFYEQALLQAKIVDDDLVKDILSIDFTRPIYSPTRCGLLAFAPTLAPDKMTPDAIRAGFKVSLAGKPGAAAELLKNLGDTTDAAAHSAAAAKFMAACKARPAKDMIPEIVSRASHLRNVVRSVKSLKSSQAGQQGGQGILEFPETLPQDSLPDSDRTFDPVTCVLK